MNNTRDLEYENSNIIYDEINESNGIKCKNYEVCEGILAPWWFDCKNNYICTHCDMIMGKWINGNELLQFTNDIECPVCLNIKRCVSQPKCEHNICIECFKLIYYDKIYNNKEEMRRCPLCRN